MRTMKALNRFSLAGALVLAFAVLCLGSCDKTYKSKDPILDKDVDQLTDAEILKMVVVVRTSLGDFSFRLRPDWAPLTTRHIIKQVKAGAYTGYSVHEVRKDLRIVLGDPDEDPNLSGVKIALETPSGPMHKGAVGLYHPDFKPDEGGTRFFVFLDQYPQEKHGGFTIFGWVIEGMPVVERIADLPVTKGTGEPRPYMPLTTVEILDVKLRVLEEK